jgi:glycosyltransferase involved in cell wall biosynthesis
LLARIGDGVLFVCDYERQAFIDKVGLAGKRSAVVHNGLLPEEFAPVAPDRDAADLLFVGDMRVLKGVDVLLEAVATLNRSRPVTACLVGDGPDLGRFQAQATALGLDGKVSFPGRMPARDAFRRGRILVMPSRAESFPYVVLEACAAGLPLIASRVGGIPEVLGPENLVDPGDAERLAGRLAAALADPAALAAGAAETRQRLQAGFTAAGMVEGILDFYRQLV